MNLSKLKQAEKAFLRRYPGGFDNPEIVTTRVKKHKPDQMLALAQESFARENFQFPERIVQNMIKVVSRSSSSLCSKNQDSEISPTDFLIRRRSF